MKGLRISITCFYLSSIFSSFMAVTTGTAMKDQRAGVSPDDSTTKAAQLDTIAEDIQHLIAAEVFESSQSSVRALAQSSQTLRQAALPFVYRNLVLVKGEKDSKTDIAYKSLIGQFREERVGDVARHVRTIAVKDDIPTEDLTLILESIAQFGTLHKISWETTAHIAPSVLDKLHTTWPELELSVFVLHRELAKNATHRQMDYTLLSSPLLKSLTYNVFFEGHRASTPARSEWPKLTRAIAAGGSLRVLRIHCQQDGTAYYGVKVLNDTEPETMMRVAISPETRLPALEEFTLREQRYWGGSTYLWDEEHCRLLRDAMDWSKLRTLKFGSDMPNGFFAAFTGVLPELKKLRFGIELGASGDTVSGFIRSIEGLESLDIDQPRPVIDLLWPAIMQHKETLKELILRSDLGNYDSPQLLEMRYLEDVANSFSSLKRLGWHVPYDTDASPKYLEIISSMGLEKLDMFLHLPSVANDYSARLTQDAMGTIPAPPLNKEGSQRTALKMMKDISAAQGKPLNRLTLHISRTGREDRWQPYLMFAKLQVRRGKREESDADDAFEFRGNQEWTGMGGDLAEDLSLEED